MQSTLFLRPFERRSLIRKYLSLLLGLVFFYTNAQTPCSPTDFVGFYGDTNNPAGSTGPHLQSSTIGQWSSFSTFYNFGNILNGPSSALGLAAAMSGGVTSIGVSNITDTVAQTSGNNFIYSRFTMRTPGPDIRLRGLKIGYIAGQNFRFSMVITDNTSGISTVLVNNESVSANYINNSFSYIMKARRAYDVKFYMAVDGAAPGTPKTVNIDNLIFQGIPIPALISNGACTASNGTANLSERISSTTPTTGYSSLRWLDASNNIVADPTSVIPGIYRAFYYNPVDNCYSEPSFVNVEDCQCTQTVNLPVNGTVNIYGVDITTVSTGSVTNYNSFSQTCVGTAASSSVIRMYPGSLQVGNSGPWQVSFTFSQPVNNLVVLLSLAGVNADRTFIFNSNGGNIHIDSPANCYSTIDGNVIYSGLGANAGNGFGGGIFRISAPSPFTTLTINGPGPGGILSFCSTSLSPTFCYKPVITTGTKLDTKLSITSLGRSIGSDSNSWPMVRKGGWLALESKTKGFVPNRVAFNSSGNPVGISAADFVEGMMVYDTTNNCLKMYITNDGITYGWYCMDAQSCPD